RGKPDLMPSQCIACGACACACPANALTIQTDDQQNSRTWQLYLGRCIYCGRCEECARPEPSSLPITLN
ncbi:4Fe-4S dicluster domain-containing protein, partial [Escherichia coli]|nr:4Fe-4S dicluster domain-containing protein [Escherichia coli]